MIGSNILYFRELKGFTQTELAQAVGHKSAAYISFLEKGERNISAQDLLKIAEVLQTPIEEFYKEPKREDMAIIKLKAGQMVKIGGIPVSLLGDCKITTHRGNYDLIKEYIVS